MPGQSNSVFVSYRREVSVYLAQALWQNLTLRGIDVFYDLESIHAGQFESIIIAQIAARPYMVPVLESGSLNRCVEEDDWFRREIEAALERDRMLVPVYTPGFDFEDIDRYLPKETASALRGFNMLEIPSKYFRHAIQELAENYLTPISRELTPVGPEARKVEEVQRRAAAEAEVGRARALVSEGDLGDAQRRLEAVLMAVPDHVEALALQEEVGRRLQAGEPNDRADAPVDGQPGDGEQDEASPPADEAPIDRPTPPHTEQTKWRRWIAVAAVGALAALVIVVVLLGGDTEVTATVEGTDAWVDTRVDLSDGDELTIEATGEVWHGNSKTLYGPNGNPNPDVRGNNVPGLEDANHSALIGKIGEDGGPFFVGESYPAVIDGEEGRLFLGINDTGLENNGGEFQAVITVGRPG